MWLRCITVLLISWAGTTANLQAGESVYLEPEQFIADSFESEPQQQVLWLTQTMKAEIRQVFGKDYPGLRIRYWQSGARTAWILE